MPFIDQCVLAGSVVRRPGGSFDVFLATWDTILAQTVPIEHELAVLLSLLLDSSEAAADHEVRLEGYAPSGEALGYVSGTVAAFSTPADENRAEFILGGRNILLPEFGRYRLEILWDGERLRRPLFFDVVDEAALPPLPD